jgi:hypothetical protein
MRPESRENLASENLYRAPTADVQSVEGSGGGRRLSVWAVVAGSIVSILTYLVSALCIFLILGVRASSGRTFSEVLAAAQSQLQGHLPLIAMALGVSLIVGGVVAAKLGRPRYVLHAAALGGLLSTLQLGSSPLVNSFRVDAPVRRAVILLVLILLPVLGAGIARCHDRLTK